MQRFRGSILGMLTMLIAQFLLGMAVNLFVTISRHHPGANAGEFFGGAVQSLFWAASQSPIVLILHAILGILILLNGIVILARSIRLTGRMVQAFAAMGLLGIVVAGVNGASFVTYNHDINSYLMAVGFAIAAVFYTQMLFVLPATDPPFRAG